MNFAKPVLILMTLTSLVACAPPPGDSSATGPLVIQQQGSFAVGGKVVSTPGTYDNNQPTTAGQTFHGDHLYAFYQLPQNPKPLPIVMLHGAFQSARSWETTPDGREGFQTLFLRRGFPVYLVDQPRRGRAGNSTVAATVEPTPFDQLFFDQFRLGKWLNYFDNVQFDPEHRPLRRRRDLRCHGRAVRQDGARHPVLAFAGGRAGLADGDQEPERQGHCRARTG
jgi:hypothetical protein